MTPRRWYNHQVNSRHTVGFSKLVVRRDEFGDLRPVLAALAGVPLHHQGELGFRPRQYRRWSERGQRRTCTA